MGKVYVIRKNISLTSSGSGLGTQFNLDNKPLTEEERGELGTFGRLGANLASHAAPFAAGWSVLSSLADDNQDDAFSALGRAGMAGVQNYSLMDGYGQRTGAKVGSQFDRMGRYLNNKFNNTTNVASPNASTGDDSIFLVDGENQVAGPASPSPASPSPASPSPASPSMVGVQETQDKALREAQVKQQAEAQAQEQAQANKKHNAAITTLSNNQQINQQGG